ncbi:AAA family ATPase [Draconibacterium halophilum]|uniref:AAA family ATPase n=1 Tax=Draconibacterium halophilum TaxID=2706887 RepID=UPI001FE5BFF3|nr:ATP-binding protein [Draconibacterium halophilum]
MKKKTKIVAITGAESTGKSTLAKALAKHYNLPFVPEFARGYVEQLQRSYTYEDVILIAQKQVEQYNEMVSKQVPLIILDTWLLITKIWLDVVYGIVPEWIDQTIKETRIDVFLVCDTDLPWVPDSVRENGGTDREKLQQTYIQELEKYQFPYQIIKGNYEERKKGAIQFISGLDTA